MVSTKSSSKELTKHGGSDNSSHAPPLGTIKARCPDPPIAQQPRPFKKNTHFHPNSWSAQTSEFGRTGKKSRVIFDPANSGLSVPPPPLKVRGRECHLRSKARWVYYILHIFIQKMSQILTFYCAIIPVAASNTQQSTENEGKIKVIGGGWLFWCYKKLTAKIGRQRKEERYFLWQMKRTYAAAFAAFNNTTIHQQAL